MDLMDLLLIAICVCMCIWNGIWICDVLQMQ